MQEAPEKKYVDWRNEEVYLVEGDDYFITPQGLVLNEPEEVMRFMQYMYDLRFANQLSEEELKIAEVK
ncbi:hypothetical protein [Eremococcus coleocola]|uniref:hypothetical protein n=1 Tax=Eremococcus coleocola TaxID=88132 RepID=UPI0004289E8E|nr:hypothetical protein [Eremococcus coleocola]